MIRLIGIRQQNTTQSQQHRTSDRRGEHSHRKRRCPKTMQGTLRMSSTRGGSNPGWPSRWGSRLMPRSGILHRRRHPCCPPRTSPVIKFGKEIVALRAWINAYDLDIVKHSQHCSFFVIYPAYNPPPPHPSGKLQHVHSWGPYSHIAGYGNPLPLPSRTFDPAKDSYFLLRR
jgi:hypothetical protein